MAGGTRCRRGLGRIHPRHRTPDVSTWWVAGIAIVWYVGIYQVSANALFDSLTALSLLIAFYYALTGVACAVFYRRHLLESAKNLLLIGVGPLGRRRAARLAAGALDPRHVRPGQLLQRPGLARRRTPLVIGIGIFLAGIALMLFWRTRDARFWQERAGVADPDVVRGRKAAHGDPDGMEG